MNLVFVVCLNPNCSCASVDMARRDFANYLYQEWNGNPLPLVPVNLSKGGNRFMGMFELESLPKSDRVKYQTQLPPNFDLGYQKCMAGSCYFFGQKHTHLMRHRNAVHPEKKLQECFPRCFVCLHQPPRPLGKDGIPFGPQRPRCLISFPTKALLDSHKEIHSDKDSNEPKIVKAKKGGRKPKEATLPNIVPPQIVPAQPILPPLVEIEPPIIAPFFNPQSDINFTSRDETPPNRRPSITSPGKDIPDRNNKRQRTEKDSESFEILPTPPEKRSRRSESPKSAFLSELRQFELALDGTSSSAVEAARKLRLLLFSQAYIRSDTFLRRFDSIWDGSTRSSDEATKLFQITREFSDGYKW